MSVVSTLSNHFMYQLMSGDISFTDDVFKLALMSGDFVFDRDEHGTYSDVSGEELSGGSYSVGGSILFSGELVEDDVNDRARMTWDTYSFPVSGESTVIRAAVIYDDTRSDKTVVGCIDFGSAIEKIPGQILEVDFPALNLKSLM